jgi:hypothetical protein
VRRRPEDHAERTKQSQTRHSIAEGQTCDVVDAFAADQLLRRQGVVGVPVALHAHKVSKADVTCDKAHRE